MRHAERTVPRAPRRRTWRRLVGAVALTLLGLVALGALFELVAAASSARRYPPPGVVHEVDGAELHLHCRGAGSPTVVLESGAGAGALAWAWVQQEVAREVRVCAYDRAGYGWSGGGGDPVDAERVATRLRDLLRAAGEEGPFVMVGHSLGGHYVRVFTDIHPDDVAAVVLVDARHPELPEVMAEHDAMMAENERALRIGLALSYVGVMRLMGGVLGAMDALPEDAAAAMAATTLRPRHMRAHASEIRSLPDIDARAAATGDLGELPLVVLAGGAIDDERLDRRALLELQEDLASLSRVGEYQLVEEADHLGILLEQAHAAVVSEAIVDLALRVRGGG